MKKKNSDLKRKISQNGPAGRVWTPNEIAVRMVHLLKKYIGGNPGFVIDPGCGPATFEKAFIETNFIPKKLVAYEIDHKLLEYTKNIAKVKMPNLEVTASDYLYQKHLVNSAEAIIMNPPYIRQENIPLNNKNDYHEYINGVLNIKVDRRSNLFVLFLLKGIIDLLPGGVLCAIVYDAINQTMYGKHAMVIINELCDNLHIETVQAPFYDTLIDAKIMLFKKLKIKRTPLNKDKDKRHHVSKLVPLEDLVNVKRGIGLQFRKAFIASPDDEFYQHSSPFFIKQKNLNGLTVDKKSTAQAYIFNDQDKMPTGLKEFINERFSMEGKKLIKLTYSFITAPILFNYYIRKNPRHLINPSEFLISDNFYAISTKFDFPTEVAWLFLNCRKYLQRIVAAGRTQGSGLTKVQLFEYKSALVPNWTLLDKKVVQKIKPIARNLIAENSSIELVQLKANKLTEEYLK